MSAIRRIKLDKIFLRRIFRSCVTSNNMENEDDDVLYFSHQKLTNLIQQSGDKNAVIKDYLKSLNYQPIKDFPQGLEWFNVSEPLSFAKHLKGKIVVVDFFTYCCINCMHIIPDLREIEQEFSVEDGLVVIGVHSAKFENEKVSSNILSAVQRYNITHPVVNDHNSEMWRSCDVNCWPTLLMLGPNANPIVMLMGEGHKENLQLYIKCALEYYKGKKQISNHKLPLKSAYHLLPDLKGPLLFPGKITSFGDDKDEILAISDTGNHRILVTKPDGTILHQIGGGKVGFKDGNFETSQFNAPQGVVFRDRNTLFVADTENHAIRKIDLLSGSVETIAGDGTQGHDKVGGKLWREQVLSSPWDLAIYRTSDMDMTFYPDGKKPIRDILVIAMAGTHQIWAIFLDDTVWWKCRKYPAGTCLCIAGSGHEENRNNAYPQNAAFAQPSGLALCSKNNEIYIADSESSCVRRLSLVDGKVTPVVGGDRNPKNLFAFGDKDGSLSEAKLQHLLGLALSKDESTLFVADTYNHKLKKVDISDNSITTVMPSTKSDSTDGETSQIFNEPAGLCFNSKGDKLYVADTNNHCIKILNVKQNTNVFSVEKLNLVSISTAVKADRSKLAVVEYKKVEIDSKGGKVVLKLNVGFNGGLKITEDAPQKWEVDLPDSTWSCVPSSGIDSDNVDVVVSVPESNNNNKGQFVDFVLNLVTCTDETCLPKSFIVRVPIGFKKSASTSVENAISVILSPDNIKIA